MKSKLLWALGAINLLLLGSLVIRYVPTAKAEPARPGDYTMIPGEIVGGNQTIVYIIDNTNRQLGARVFDDNRKQFNDMLPPFDLDRVFNNAPQGGGRGR